MAALIIEGSEYSIHQIYTTCTYLGHPKYKDTYRSELEGIFHVVSKVENISKKSNILKVVIIIACDGLNVIKIREQ